MFEQEKELGKAGRLAFALLRMDLVILDELGHLPFSQAGGALLFHLPWSLKRPETPPADVLSWGEDQSSRFHHGTATTKSRIKSREQSKRTRISREDGPS